MTAKCHRWNAEVAHLVDYETATSVLHAGAGVPLAKADVIWTI